MKYIRQLRLRGNGLSIRRLIGEVTSQMKEIHQYNRQHAFQKLLSQNFAAKDLSDLARLSVWIECQVTENPLFAMSINLRVFMDYPEGRLHHSGMTR